MAKSGETFVRDFNEIADDTNPGGVAVPELPGIDVADGLDRVCGNWEVYCLILRVFREKEANVGELLEQCINQRQWQDAAYIAHTLKGSSGNLVAMQVYQQAITVEDACSDEDVQAALAALVCLRREMNTVIQSIATLEVKKPGEQDSLTGKGHPGIGNAVTSNDPANIPSNIGALLDKMLNDLDNDLGEAQQCLEVLRGKIDADQRNRFLDPLSNALNNFDVDKAKQIIQLERERLMQTTSMNG